jgi:hypothetical protein
MHELNKIRKTTEFKKAGGAYVTRDELEEALAPIRAALEVSDLDVAIDELDGLEDDAVSGDPTSRPSPAPAVKDRDSADSTKESLSGSDKAHPAESDPEGLELVEKIHERKSRAKRKPEGQDPLGVLPEPEGDDS